jgi:hypothetical protein
MLDPEAPIRRVSLSRGRWVALVSLGLLCWLSRVSLPHASATVELDPTYAEALGTALKQGLRFGREIVFTSGPLAYFTSSPYDPELYAAKFWLWEVLFGALVAALLFWRLARRGTWLDIGVGALVLIFLPVADDAWLFAIGLTACDLGLSAEVGGSERRIRALNAVKVALAMLVLSLLTLIKVTTLTFALACVAILVLRACSRRGVSAGVRRLAAFAGVQVLVWMCIGQRIEDLLPYFWSSIQLASGFDSAMSLPPSTLALVSCAVCLPLGLGSCWLFARKPTSAVERRGFDATRALAAMSACALLLSYKSGFARASDHIAIFFGTAMIVPLFLLPEQPPGEGTRQSREARLRCAVALLAALCGLAVAPTRIRWPDQLIAVFENRLRLSTQWLSHPEASQAYFEQSRARLVTAFALPRTTAIVGSRGISSFAEGDGVIFLNQLSWKPRPVFQAFSVLTQRTTRENAAFLASSSGPDFLLWRQGGIDRRIPSSEDPLTLQVLLRDFRVRAHESEFLLLERAGARTSEPRTTLAHAELAWGERLELPPSPGPAVLRGKIAPSVFGRARAALYQTPEVFVDVEFADAERETYRVAPFALEAGFVLRPWLPTKVEWIANARGRPTRSVVAVSFRTPGASAFASRIEVELESAPDLSPRPIDPQVERELVLGAIGEMPLSFESPVEPELGIFESSPVLLFAQAPARVTYGVGPGISQLKARLCVPPWIASAKNFPGARVLVLAREGGVERECQRIELGSGRPGEPPARFNLDTPVTFAGAGELILELQAAPGGDPGLARVGICNLRVGR